MAGLFSGLNITTRDPRYEAFDQIGANLGKGIGDELAWKAIMQRPEMQAYLQSLRQQGNVPYDMDAYIQSIRQQGNVQSGINAGKTSEMASNVLRDMLGGKTAEQIGAEGATPAVQEGLLKQLTPQLNTTPNYTFTNPLAKYNPYTQQSNLRLF